MKSEEGIGLRQDCSTRKSGMVSKKEALGGQELQNRKEGLEEPERVNIVANQQVLSLLIMP
ncbi:hypothetical protein VIBNIFTn2_930011 [Vibrio nigripulchritudo FTn2]|nr:hypothetical protein VIBNIFTn2_930011 [Vibrio nigripulchritudo FTn2]